MSWLFIILNAKGAMVNTDWSSVVGLTIDNFCKEISLHLVNVHREITMSKVTIYPGRQYDVQSVQSVHSLYEVPNWDIKLKPGWKVLVRSLCTIAMFWNAPTWYCLRGGRTRITRSTMRELYRVS